MTGDAWREAAATLDAGLAALGCDAALAGALLKYLRLLDRWGRAINLTAVRNPVDMVRLHLLDSLAVRCEIGQQIGDRPHSPENGVCPQFAVADVGSGAGLPGIPLAIALPGVCFVLLESVARKASFLRQVVTELDLRNVQVVQERAENYRPQAGFATVTSRALAALPEFVRVAGHLCAPGGRLLAMKGRRPDEEIEALPPGWRVAAIHEIHVPGLDAERTLVEIIRESTA